MTSPLTDVPRPAEGAAGVIDNASAAAPAPSQPTAARRAVRFAIGLIVLGLLGAYLWSARHALAEVLQVRPRYLVPMIAVPLLSLWLNGSIGRDLAAAFGARLSFVEWYGLAVVNSLGNYLPLPQAGAMARGVYLKRVHGMPYGPFAATLVVTYATAVALFGVLGLAGLTALRAAGEPSPVVLWVIFAALASAVVMLTPATRFVPLPAKLSRIHEDLGALRRRHLIAGILARQAGLVLLTATGLWLACKAVHGGEHVTWPTAAMLGLIIQASGIANVTPGNVGVEQFAAEITGRLLDVPPNIGLVASAIYRAVSLLVVLVIGPFFSAALARRRAVG